MSGQFSPATKPRADMSSDISEDNSIMVRLLPLFPLELVAFPGAPIPLHIFEPRYREMVGEAEAAGSEFGIVLARDGGIVRTGCTVIVESVLQRYSDGRFDVLTRGRRRFEIRAVDEEKEYLRAEVDYFSDSPAEPAPAQLRTEALAVWQRLQHETGNSFSGETPDPDDASLSFRLAPALSDLDIQNTLLMSRSETERLRHILEFAPRNLERRQYADRMRLIAPSNGKGHKPAEA